MGTGVRAPRVDPNRAGHPARRGRWWPWLVGALGFAAVLVVVGRAGELGDLAAVLRAARPGWLVVAAVLQASTYLAQALVWRAVARAAGQRLALGTAYGLSLAKLLLDQALPSAGVAGTVAIGRALRDRGLPHRAVVAAVVVETVSYHLTYVACLGAAALVALAHHQARPLVLWTALGFAAVALLGAIALLRVAGRAAPPVATAPGWHPLRRALDLLHEADPRLVRAPRLLLRACALQLAIFLLDATTLGVLAIAFGGEPTVGGVFASSVLATLFRTIGVLPGGLGAFEAAAIASLRATGLDLSVAVAATVAFRGLSFWLPMLPGLLASRRLLAAGPSAQ